MLFLNMCEDIKAGELIERRNGKSFGFRVPDAEGAVAGGLKVNGDVLEWGECGKGENIAEFGLTGEDLTVEYRKGLTYDAIAETEENPIIFVLCSKLSFFKGMVADVKVLRLDDEHILAALISGACEFNGVALERCVKSTKDYVVGKDLDIAGLFKGTFIGKSCEGKVDYSHDALCHIEFSFKKDGAFGVRSVREKEFIFDDRQKSEGEEKVRKTEEEKRLEAERIKAERIEAGRKAEEARQAKIEAEKERLQAVADLKKSGVKVDKSSKVINVGASDFLKAVAALSN